MNKIQNIKYVTCMLFLFTLIAGCLPTKAATPAKEGKKMTKYPTIGNIITSGAAREDSWYWVDTRKINIDDDLDSPDDPLKEAGKAIVIPSDKYFSNYRVVSDGCEAFRLKKITTPEGEKAVLSRKVSILHWGKQVTLEQSVMDAMKVDELQDGVHYFKISNKGDVSAIQSKGEVAFLRSYYRIRVSAPHNAKRIVTYEKIRPLVASYTIYEYYPSGHMQRKVEIDEAGLLRPPRDGEENAPDPNADDRDKLIEYEVRDMKFADKGTPQTTSQDETITTLQDRANPMFVQNILHD